MRYVSAYDSRHLLDSSIMTNFMRALQRVRTGRCTTQQEAASVLDAMAFVDYSILSAL